MCDENEGGQFFRGHANFRLKICAIGFGQQLTGIGCDGDADMVLGVDNFGIGKDCFVPANF